MAALKTCLSEWRCAIPLSPAIIFDVESERAEGREERGENGPLDDRRRRRIHCRNGGSQIAEILISNIFFVWKSVAGAFLSCVRRAARPAWPWRAESLTPGRKKGSRSRENVSDAPSENTMGHGSTSCLSIKRCSRSWSRGRHSLV